MLHRGALYLLILALAVLASPGLAPSADAQTTIIVDDDFFNCVDGLTPNWYTISAAVADASPGDTIRVCEGDYTEPSMTIYDNELTITSSGPAVTHVHWTGDMAAMFFIQADNVVVQGLDLDATPAHPADASTGILISRDSATIQNNEIRNATGAAVATSHVAAPSYVQVLSNNIHDSATGVVCRCYDSALSGNTVNVGGNTALALFGRGAITSNVVVDGTVGGYGEDVLVANNQISGITVDPLIDVMGNRIGITDNTLSDTTGYGIKAESPGSPGSASTDVTIARNTFSQVGCLSTLWTRIPVTASP